MKLRGSVARLSRRRFCGRERDLEGATATNRALDSYVPVVCERYQASDGQAEPMPAGGVLAVLRTAR